MTAETAETESIETKADEKKRKGATAAKKIKLAFDEDENCRLSWFQACLKEREIKDVDLSDIVKEALQQVPQSWWQDKLEDLTPLEWKIRAAMEDPELREKLASLLSRKEERSAAENS